jgi:hypothetical protein
MDYTLKPNAASEQLNHPTSIHQTPGIGQTNQIGALTKILKTSSELLNLARGDPNVQITKHICFWDKTIEILCVFLHPKISNDESFLSDPKNFGYYLNIPDGTTIVNM